MKKPRVHLMIPVWRRPQIFELFCKQLELCYEFWQEEIDCSFAFCFSGEDPELDQLMLIYNRTQIPCSHTFCNNSFLGAKHNTTLQLAMMGNPDYIMNIGSDDLIHPALMEFYMPYMRLREPFFGLSSGYIYDPQANQGNGHLVQFSYINSPYAIGGCRMISSLALHKLLGRGKTLYCDKAQRGLDGNSSVKLHQLGYTTRLINPGDFPYVCGIKSEVNINPMERILQFNSRGLSVIKTVPMHIITCGYPILNSLSN